mgnify:CR=1 FL=1
MSYTKRTCTQCGYRDIQPNMKQISENYTSGYSQKAISGRSIAGAFLGDPRAQRQNGDWLFGNTKRKYTRNRKVWVCKNGCGVATNESSSGSSFGFIKSTFKFIFQAFLMAVILLAIVVISG